LTSGAFHAFLDRASVALRRTPTFATPYEAKEAA
jgi:hypothetical protein